jgi:hypothetical protein
MAQRRLVELVLKGKDETKEAFDGAEKNVLGLSKANVQLAAKVATVSAAFVAAGAAVYKFVDGAATAGDRAEKLSYRLGLTVEVLSELEYIAQSGGVQINQMAMAMQRMTRRVAEAAKGTGEAKDAIRELGIDAVALARLSPDQQFYEIAAALQEVERSSDRVRLAFKLFDSEGLSVIQTLKKDLRETRAEFEKFGGPMSSAFASASEGFKQSQENLANATQRLKEALAEPFLAPFTLAVNTLAAAIAGAKAVLPGVPGGVLSTIPGAVGAWYGGLANGAMVPPPSSGYTPRAFDYLGGTAPFVGNLPGLTQAPMGGFNYQPLPIMDMPGQYGMREWGDWQSPEWQGLTDDTQQVFDDLASSVNTAFEVSENRAAQFATTFGTVLGTGFANALFQAENFGDALVGLLQSAFAAATGSFFGNIFGSVFGGGNKAATVSAATKGMPGSATLAGAGAYNYAAGAAYGKAFA